MAAACLWLRCPTDVSGLNINGALIFASDGSQLPESKRWQRETVREAMKITGNQDYFDVMYVDGTERWMGGHNGDLPRLGPVRKQLIRQIDAVAVGDIESSIERGAVQLLAP